MNEYRSSTSWRTGQRKGTCSSLFGHSAVAVAGFLFVGLTEVRAVDCNDNGVEDSIDIADGTSPDCQPDGIPDECQLVNNDCNGDEVPDDCGLFADCGITPAHVNSLFRPPVPISTADVAD